MSSSMRRSPTTATPRPRCKASSISSARGDVEIKRDMEQGRDEVRIMTVHGAKGLQAPIVFLPDTCMRPRLQGVRLYALPRAGEPPEEVGHLIWPPAGHSKLAGIEDSKALAERAEREEYHRLLYVAMTRAEDRLYICGWEGLQKREAGAVWYDLVRDGLGGLLADVVGPDGAHVRRMESPQTQAAKGDESEPEQRAVPPLPDWALTPARPERARRRLTPSRLTPPTDGRAEGAFAWQPPLGPRALSANHRFARGRLVHALLQHLPELDPEHQELAARAFVAARGADLAQELQEEIIAETLAIAGDRALCALVPPGQPGRGAGRGQDRRGRGRLSSSRARSTGSPSSRTSCSSSTTRPIARRPRRSRRWREAYIDQLAAYRLALKRLFPGRSLRAALLWTDGARLMEIPSTSLDSAERRILAGPAKP